MYNGNATADYTAGYIAGTNSNGNGNNGYGNGMWGDNGWWVLVILFALFGWGGNGWGNGGFGGGNGGVMPYMVGSTFTDASLQRGFDTQSIIGKLDGINQGLCDGFYAMNTGMLNATNNLSSAVCNLGYEQAQLANQTQLAIMQGNNAISSQIAQYGCDNRVGQMQIQNAIDSCCCQTGRAIERGFADTNYNMATNTCALQTSIANSTRDIIDSQNAGTRAILDYLCQDKISTLQNENQALRLSASQAQQNAAIGAMITASEANIIRRTGNDCPIPAYFVPNPNCCYGNYGFNNGFGCNNCCGC